MPKIQRLPLGDSSFESIRTNECVYVDKTRHLFQIVDEGKFYFMSRPRRFGKSLTISTLRCLFQGRKDLFDGLWMADNTEWKWKAHPVVLLDFNGISHDTPENLKLDLADYNGFWGGDNPLKSLCQKGCDVAGFGDILTDAGHICPPGSFPFPGGTCLKLCRAGICT